MRMLRSIFYEVVVPSALAMPAIIVFTFAWEAIAHGHLIKSVVLLAMVVWLASLAMKWMDGVQRWGGYR